MLDTIISLFMGAFPRGADEFITPLVTAQDEKRAGFVKARCPAFSPLVANAFLAFSSDRYGAEVRCTFVTSYLGFRSVKAIDKFDANENSSGPGFPPRPGPWEFFYSPTTLRKGNTSIGPPERIRCPAAISTCRQGLLFRLLTIPGLSFAFRARVLVLRFRFPCCKHPSSRQKIWSFRRFRKNLARHARFEQRASLCWL
jgi:hypothetical protein